MIKHKCMSCGKDKPLPQLRRVDDKIVCTYCIRTKKKRTPSLVEVITWAIKHGMMMSITYNGERRIIEPHVLSTKDDRAYLHAFQKDKGWRTFFLDKIEKYIVHLSEHQGQRGTITDRSQRWDNVLVDVSRDFKRE